MSKVRSDILGIRYRQARDGLLRLAKVGEPGEGLYLGT